MDPTSPHAHDVLIREAGNSADFEIASGLFREYAASLRVDLSFQDFDSELATIDQQYARPGGALLLAFCDGAAVGCAGIRALDTQTAELKRMFVRPDFQKQKIGRKLLDQALRVAKALGYRQIRLDTLPDMERAQQLYKRYGFYEIASYRYNPVKGTVYMEKKLE